MGCSGEVGSSFERNGDPVENFEPRSDLMYVFIHRVGKQEAIRVIQVKETGEA